jgi:hypothetical protein
MAKGKATKRRHEREEVTGMLSGLEQTYGTLIFQQPAISAPPSRLSSRTMDAASTT